MRIGIAGPMTLELLKPYLPDSCPLPQGYPFPMTAILVGELLQRGYEITAYTTSTDITETYTVSGPKLTLCVSPSRPRHRAKTLFREDVRGLVNSLQAHPCDVLHAHWTYEFAMAALASGLPSLITIHDWAWAILCQYKDAYRLVRWGINAYTTRRAPHLSTVSPYMWEHLPPSVRQKTHVIPNFVTDSLSDRSAPNAPREDYLISVCNGFSRRKNLETALLGFRQAQSSLKGVRYLLVGQDCQPGGPAQRFCEANGCLENVVFAGPVSYDRVLDMVGNALAMLHPSYEKSFGMSVLEAMALGTPVIAGAQSGNMPHLIQHGTTGFLCDVAEPASIGTALRTLRADDSLRRSIGIAARRHGKENYSASVVVGRYLDAYQEILGGRSRALETCLCN